MRIHALDVEALQQQREEQLKMYLPKLTEADQRAILYLFHNSFRRTDTKRMSANKLYSQTLIDMIKDMDPMIVCNGQEYRRYTFVDAVILPPTMIRGDGLCERIVPQDCLDFSKGYTGDVFAFIREEIFLMKCIDESVHFDTRQEQQSKRRVAIEAASNEGISTMNLYEEAQDDATNNQIRAEQKEQQEQQQEQEQQQQRQAVSELSFSPDTYSTPNHLLSKGELIAKFGQLVSSHLYPYVKLFDMAVLLKSCLDNMSDGLGIEYNECMLDDGGNFITNSGVEKILMFRHALCPNVRISQHKKNQRQSQYHVECRSEHTNENRSTSTFYLSFKNDKLTQLDSTTGRITDIGYVVGEVSQTLQNIPFVIWVRALGIESDDAIRHLYSQVLGKSSSGQQPGLLPAFHQRILDRSLQEHQGCRTTQQAILKLGHMVGGKSPNEQWFWGRKKLRTEVLPHIGKKEDEKRFREQCKSKARFLCHMLQDLLLTVEYDLTRKASGAQITRKKKDNVYLTDRDSYFYRMFQAPDELLATLIQQYFRPHVTKFIPQTILKKLDRGLSINVHEVFNMYKISKSLNYNISMGIWHSQPNIKTQTGVSQNIARHNYCDTLSQHDKIMNPIHKEGKQIDPRLLHETAIAVACCVDSPEGEASGLHRQRAQFVHQALHTPFEPIVRLLLEDVTPEGGFRYMYAWAEWEQAKAHDPAFFGRGEGDECCCFFWNIMVNQIPIGFSVRPDALLKYLRELRRLCVISSELSCSYGLFSDPWDVSLDLPLLAQTREPCLLDIDDNEPYKNQDWCKRASHLRKFNVELRTHSARNLRELFVVSNLWKLNDALHKLSSSSTSNNNRSAIELLSHQDLLSEGIIEYVDVEECRDCLIAAEIQDLNESLDKWLEKDYSATILYPASKRTNTFTHAELHPSFLYGICAAMIPFAQCNPPARNAFQAHMQKHAQGQATLISKAHRMDTNYNEKFNAERASVQTDVGEVLGTYRLSTDTDHTIKICCDANEEDSQDINGSVTQLGYFGSSNYHTTVVCERKNKTKTEKIGLFAMGKVTAYKVGCDYSKLDERGIIREGAEVEKNTVLVQKHVNNVDTSVVHQSSKRAVAEKVKTYVDDRGLLVVRIRMRETRMSECGDKNASKHAQKGVINRLRRRENMHYHAETGIFPAVIYNSSAFISRSTFAMYLEMMFGELAAIKGEFASGTPFTRDWTRLLEFITPEERASAPPLHCIAVERAAMGLHPFASHSSIDAKTGKRVSHHGLVFSGIASMMKLKQMAVDKLRARGLGAISYSTKQPTSTKEAHGQNGSSQKCGAMENSSLMAYGASEVLYDRMLVSSDPTYTHTCQICHNQTIYVESMDMNYCLHCEKQNTALNVFGSATCGLFSNELLAMGSLMKIHSRPLAV